MTNPTPPPVQPQKESPLAIAAMICGALSLTGPGLLLGIPAIILGAIALKRNDPGRSLSLAGLITGAISTVLSLIVIVFFISLIIWGALQAPTPAHDTPDSPSYDSSRT